MVAIIKLCLWPGILVLTALVNVVQAFEVYEFDSLEQEQRYQSLIAQLRCPKCLNTNLSGSDAPISQDLRHQVYELINAGKTDTEIKDFLRARYGDFILYQPRLMASTIFLWFMPLLLLLIAVVALTVHIVRSSHDVDNVAGEDDLP